MSPFAGQFVGSLLVDLEKGGHFPHREDLDHGLNIPRYSWGEYRENRGKFGEEDYENRELRIRRG